MSPSEPKPPQPPQVFQVQALTFVCLPFCETLAVDIAMSHVERAHGAAQRRRARMVRSWWRHEQMSLAAALADASHHSAQQYGAPRGQKPATKASEGEVREQYYGLRAQERPLPGMRPAPLSEVLPQVVLQRTRGEARDEAHGAAPSEALPLRRRAGGMRPPPLFEVLPQVVLQRHTVEQRIVHTPYVQILDAPVPQKVDQLVDFFKNLDIEVPAQVIEVLKISQDIIPQRSVDLVPQLVEQLVEVPTVLTPTRIAVQIAEQIVGIPVPHGRGQGSLPGLGSPASGKHTSEQIVEQIVDFPVQTVEQLVDTSPSNDCALGSSSSAGPADEEFTGVFRTFPHRKKKCRVPGKW